MSSRSDETVKVTLFDYGVGNLHSIKKALERSGAQVTVTKRGEIILQAEAIVLPGVGAFGASMRPLDKIRDRLRDRLEGGLPCLAVCIGMQLLFEGSQESPDTPGIGFLPGTVRTLPRSVGKVPHLGWNTLEAVPAPTTGAWQDVVPETGTYAYYVHSYLAPPSPKGLLALTRYGPADNTMEIPAVLAHRNTLATQFHPEKSSHAGLRLIERWVRKVQDPPVPQREEEASGEAAGDATGEASGDPPTQANRRGMSSPEGPEGKH